MEAFFRCLSAAVDYHVGPTGIERHKCIFVSLVVRDVLRKLGITADVMPVTLHREIAVERNGCLHVGSVTIGDPEDDDDLSRWKGHMVVATRAFLLDASFGQTNREWNLELEFVGMHKIRFAKVPGPGHLIGFLPESREPNVAVGYYMLDDAPPWRSTDAARPSARHDLVRAIVRAVEPEVPAALPRWMNSARPLDGDALCSPYPDLALQWDSSLRKGNTRAFPKALFED